MWWAPSTRLVEGRVEQMTELPKGRRKMAFGLDLQHWFFPGSPGCWPPYRFCTYRENYMLPIPYHKSVSLCRHALLVWRTLTCAGVDEGQVMVLLCRRRAGNTPFLPTPVGSREGTCRQNCINKNCSLVFKKFLCHFCLIFAAWQVNQVSA